jgi:hypothetical protein
MSVQHTELQYGAKTRRALASYSQHLWADVRSYDSLVWLDVLMSRYLQNHVTCSGCGIQQVRPGLSSDEGSNSALPEAMDAEAEEIGQEVVPRSDSTKDIVNARMEARRIGGICRIGGSDRAFDRHAEDA